jgi:hypothetical protein
MFVTKWCLTAIIFKLPDLIQYQVAADRVHERQYNLVWQQQKHLRCLYDNGY